MVPVRKTNNSKSSNKKTCDHCNKPGHVESECWLKPGQEHLCPTKRRHEDSSKKAKKPTFTAEQMTHSIAGTHKAANKHNKRKATKKKRCQVTFKSDSSDKEGVCEASKWLERQTFDNSSSDSKSSKHSQSFYAINSRKKRKTGHHSTEVLGEILDRTGDPTPICILLDSGTTSTMVLRNLLHKNVSKYKGQPTKWKTMGGIFTTKRKAIIEFKLPEFSNSRTIQTTAHVDDTTQPKSAQHNMIVGTDLLEKLGTDLMFSKKLVIWDDLQIPMKDRGTISDRDLNENTYEATQQPSILCVSEDRHGKVIKQMYAKVDIDEDVTMLNLSENVKK